MIDQDEFDKVFKECYEEEIDDNKVTLFNIDDKFVNNCDEEWKVVYINKLRHSSTTYILETKPTRLLSIEISVTEEDLKENFKQMTKKEDVIRRFKEAVEQIKSSKRRSTEILQEISVYKIGDKFIYPDVDNTVYKISHLTWNEQVDSITYCLEKFVDGGFIYDFVMDEEVILQEIENNSMILKN